MSDILMTQIIDGVIGKFLILSNDRNIINRCSEGGVTVSMDAFQAFDPGSTPGPRMILAFYPLLK
jgi:hypothetical protein